MGGCIDKCCWGTFGSRCCNVISLVGFIYFGLNFLIFWNQQHFYDFKIEDAKGTRLGMLITASIFLVLFVATFFRISQLDRQSQMNPKPNYSIHDNPTMISDKQPSPH